MDFALIRQVFPFFVEAALMTIAISALALVLGLAVAALVTAGRLSSSRLWQWPAAAFVSIFRGTPCLIQLFVIYFGGPQIGINLDPFTAGVVGLGLNIGAYMSESMRGGIAAVDRGQVEAARAIGFGKLDTLWRVVLPQAARLMIRPLGVNAVALVKGSSLVSTISVIELTYTAQRFIGSTYKPFEIFGIAAILYMIIVYAMARVVDMLDRRFAIP